MELYVVNVGKNMNEIHNHLPMGLFTSGTITIFLHRRKIELNTFIFNLSFIMLSGTATCGNIPTNSNYEIFMNGVKSFPVGFKINNRHDIQILFVYNIH